MLGTPYQTKLTFLANLLTILRILLQWKLDYDIRGLVVTVKPLQRHISDSPHRSGDCPTTAWCGPRLTVLKHPHCGHSHASVVKYP